MLTIQEQEYGNNLIAYYKSPVVKDDKKVSDFIYAIDKSKIIMIKEFLINVIQVQKEADLEVYNQKVSELTAEIQIIINYLK